MANQASARTHVAVPEKICGVVVKLPPVGKATPPVDAVTGWPVNVPLKMDRPMGFAVGVTVWLPMTISGTMFFSESVSPSEAAFGSLEGFEACQVTDTRPGTRR